MLESLFLRQKVCLDKIVDCKKSLAELSLYESIRFFRIGTACL